MTGVILAGGKNTRMRANKALLKIGDAHLIDRTVDALKGIFAEVIIVTSNPLEYMHLDATIVTDIFPERGALGGLYTGLFFARAPYAFVAACDMPFLKAPFIAYMMENAKGHDIVVPAPPDGLQPLCAVYSRACLPAIKNLLAKNRLQIKGFYPGRKILEIGPAILERFDPEGRMFTNINTPEDWESLQKSLKNGFLEVTQSSLER
jgi:molybdopterin-guanine dinucleotide biosynthesis protein A